MHHEPWPPANAVIESLIGRRWVPWVIAIALMAGVGWMAASFKGCSDNRVERKRLDTAPAVANANLEALKAALAAKDATIDSLVEQINSFTCEGEMTVIRQPDGRTEKRCVGKSSTEDRKADHTTSQTATPVLPLPAVPPDLGPSPQAVAMKAPPWTWQAAGGAGFAQGAPAYYARVARRVWGPLGAELTVLYPLGALAGVCIVR